MSTSNLSRIPLAWPTPLRLAATTDGARRSWVQLAKTGSFVSTRYGKFSITREDLSTMLHNYTTIMPKAPTELPVDFDHLSMDPKRPGDGIAAGWMKRLELREDGDELWCEVEWTPKAADAIRNREYQFVSPSFVKDYVSKSGEKIGTTLLAAAITNHPFLEGMSALTLYNFSTLGDLALADSASSGGTMDIGQRVMIAPGQARTQDEIGGTFEITEVVGDGANAFVTIKDANGVPHKWFRATELLPASATPANPIQPNLHPAPGTPAPGAPKANTPGGIPAAKAHPMPQDTAEKATAFAERVTALSKGRTLRDAISLATTQAPEDAEAYRALGVGATVGTETEPAPVLSLSARTGESFDQLALRYATEHGVSLRQAVHEVGKAQPTMAANR